MNGYQKRVSFGCLLVLLLFLFSPVNVSAEVATDDERAPQQSVAEEGLTVLTAEDLNNGTYEIEVKSSSSMFRIVHAELTVEERSMHAAVTLGGTGYSMLYMGTGEEAVSADASSYVPYTEDADGAYVYEIEVSALNAELECTGFSKRKEKWYDHQILFRADTLPDGAVKEQIVEPEIAPLEDGIYEVEVSFAGGTGRASVETPARVTVSDGIGEAKIVWSSPNYDYMIVNGTKLLPLPEDDEDFVPEHSVFRIPVIGWDKETNVIADTTAMSTPHEITYTLTFASGSAVPVKEDITGASAPANSLSCRMTVALIVILLAILYAYMRRGRSKRDGKDAA